MLDVAHAHDLDGVRVHEYRQYYKITYTDLCVYIFVEEATSGGLPLPSSFLASSYPSDLLLYCQTMKTRGWGEGRRLFQGRRRKRRESSGSWGECCLVRGLTCYSEMMMLFYSLCFPIFFNHKEYDYVCVCVCVYLSSDQASFPSITAFPPSIINQPAQLDQPLAYSPAETHWDPLLPGGR